MIQYQEALDLIKSNAHILNSEKVDLSLANKRILAEDVYYDQDIPPFDKSAMDGYACRNEDIGNELRIIETIYAGQQPLHPIRKNECSKIMTGAVIPSGADCVFISEVAKQTADDRVICTSQKTLPNICYEGEDVKKGDLALPVHTLISSKHIPVLAGAGVHQPMVFCQPGISVFATGNELVEPGAKPLPHQIRNSNSYQMMAQSDNMGIKAIYQGIIKDDEKETEQKILKALTESDLVILSGGVSMGDSDYIPDILKKIEFDIILSESAIQPGKPIIFAKKEDQYCFGLAGNPVSSFVQFELYVKPFIYSMMGYEFTPPSNRAILSKNYYRKRVDRLKLIPAMLNEKNEATLVEFHGSAHIAALQSANCLVEIPLGVSGIKKGDKVNVRPI
ncbi:gephyrin-like molybdotransferase Glp [Bacteroidota bacterium]